MKQTKSILLFFISFTLLIIIATSAFAYDLKDNRICGNTADAKVWIARGDGTQLKMIDDGIAPCLSPNNKYIAYYKAGEIIIRKTSNKKIVASFAGEDVALTNSAAYYTVYDGMQSKIWWRPITGGTAQRLTDSGPDIYESIPSAGGSIVAYRSEYIDDSYDYSLISTIDCYDSETGEFTTLTWAMVTWYSGIPYGDYLDAIDLSCDGQHLTNVRIDVHHNDYYVEADGVTWALGYDPVMINRGHGICYYDDELYETVVIDFDTLTATEAPFLDGITDAVMKNMKKRIKKQK